jgi:hypothetical protein
MPLPRDWLPPYPPTSDVARAFNTAHRKAYDDFERRYPSSTWEQRQDAAMAECIERGIERPQ